MRIILLAVVLIVVLVCCIDRDNPEDKIVDVVNEYAYSSFRNGWHRGYLASQDRQIQRLKGEEETPIEELFTADSLWFATKILGE